MKYPFLENIEKDGEKVKNKGLVIAEYKSADLDETELNIFAVIDFRTTEINCSGHVAKNRLERRDFVSIQNPELYGSKDAFGEDLSSVIYQEFDVDMFHEVPTTVDILNYVNLREFLNSVNREDLADQPYLSNEDITKILEIALANEEELGFGGMQR